MIRPINAFYEMVVDVVQKDYKAKVVEGKYKQTLTRKQVGPITVIRINENDHIDDKTHMIFGLLTCLIARDFNFDPSTKDLDYIGERMYVKYVGDTPVGYTPDDEIKSKRVVEVIDKRFAQYITRIR